MVKSHGRSTAAEELHDGKLPGACGPRGAPKGGEAHGEILRDSRCWDGWDLPLSKPWDLHRKNDGTSMKTMGFTMILHGTLQNLLGFND